jgi:nucleotide-binding universal stress UspA family protein
VFRSILVALDGSRSADQVLEEAIEIARRDGARLTLISVATQPRWRFTSPYLVAYPTDADLVHDAERILARAEALVPDEVPVCSIVRRGDVARAILERVRDAEHDLVVMGSHGRGPIRALLLGSVSRSVVAKSPVPVHIARAGSNVREAAPWTTRSHPAAS